MKDDIDVRTYFLKHNNAASDRTTLSRTINALERGGIETMGGLLAADGEKVKRVRNLGAKSIAVALLMRDKYASEKTNSLMRKMDERVSVLKAE